MGDDEEEEDENYGKGPPPLESNTAATVTQEEYAPRDSGVSAEQVGLDTFEDPSPDEEEEQEEGDEDFGVSLDDFEADSDEGDDDSEVSNGSDVDSSEQLDELLGRKDEDQILDSLDSSFYENDLTPDAPDSVNIDEAVEFQTMEDGEGETGASEGAMVIGVTEDGDRMFITRNSPEAMGDIMDANAAMGHLKDAIEDDEITDQMPEIHVDEEREAAVLSDVGGEDSTPAGNYLLENDEYYDESESWSEESYKNAIGVKVVAGDGDISRNIVTDSSGTFHPIDFDLAGTNLKDKHEKIQNKDNVGRDYDGVWDKLSVNSQFQTDAYAEIELGPEDVKESAEAVANSIDADALDENLKQDSNVAARTRQSIVANVRMLSDDE